MSVLECRLLEKKIALERETQAALDPEVGAAEVIFAQSASTVCVASAQSTVLELTLLQFTTGASHAERDPSDAIALLTTTAEARANDHRDGASDLQA